MIHLEVTKLLIRWGHRIDEVHPLNKQRDISTTKWLYESGFLFISEQRRGSKLSFKCFQELNILISKNNIKKK